MQGTNESKARPIAGLWPFWLRASRATLLLLVVSGGAMAGCSSSDEEPIERQNEAAGPAQTGTPADLPQGRTLDEPTPEIERPDREEPLPGESREESVFDLRAGDCLSDESPDLVGEEILTVTLVNCASPEAKFRVLDSFLVEQSEGPWPGQTYIDGQVAFWCPFQTVNSLYPTDESWEHGDRTIHCLDDLTQVTSFELVAGDCFSGELSSQVTGVTIEDCSSGEADYQVLDAFVVEQPDGPWPGIAYMEQQVNFWCPLATEFYFYPTQGNWARGARTIMCIDALTAG